MWCSSLSPLHQWLPLSRHPSPGTSLLFVLPSDNPCRRPAAPPRQFTPVLSCESCLWLNQNEANLFLSLKMFTPKLQSSSFGDHCHTGGSSSCNLQLKYTHTHTHTSPWRQESGSRTVTSRVSFGWISGSCVDQITQEVPAPDRSVQDPAWFGAGRPKAPGAPGGGFLGVTSLVTSASG